MQEKGFTQYKQQTTHSKETMDIQFKNVLTNAMPHLTLVRWFIIGGRAWVSIHCWCHGTQTKDSSRICHCLLFHEHSKQNFVQPCISAVKETTMATHTLGLNTIKSWAESLALMSVIMHCPYLKRTQLLCVIGNVCEQPALFCHGPQLYSVDPSALS